MIFENESMSGSSFLIDRQSLVLIIKTPGQDSGRAVRVQTM